MSTPAASIAPPFAAASPALVFAAMLGACVWVGGFVTIVVVARVARRVLERPAQVAFFRTLGRRYLLVGVPALALAMGAGGALLSDRPWDGRALAAVLVCAALGVVLAAGVAQARAMSRLRGRLLAAPGDDTLGEQVRRGAVQAVVLRALIGALSLALLALAAVLA